MSLFLDTICNTFGGILFILLFVILTLKATEKDFNQSKENFTTAHDMEVLSDQIEDSHIELADINDLYLTVKTELDEIDLPALQSFIDEFNEQLAENKKLKTEYNDLDERLRAVQEEIRQAEIPDENILVRLQNLIDDLEDSIDDPKTKVNVIKNEVTRNQTMPQLQAVDKDRVVLVLCFGKLYRLHTSTSTEKESLYLNTDDFVVVKSTYKECYVSPKPWCGIDLSDTETAEIEIEKLMQKFPNSKFRISLVVCDDSFRNFGPVSAVLKKLDYMISPFMFSELSTYGYSDRGGTIPSKAQ